MDNYFAFYEIPESFQPDAGIVKKKFYELSRLHHPDRAAQAGAEAIAEAQQLMALNNKAYNTLKDKDATMQYLLRLKGVLEEEEKYNLPPGFLMEMMELNEAVSDYELEPDEKKLQWAVGSWQAQMEQLNKELETIINEYEEMGNEGLLRQIKDLYYRKKYLLRIQERINTFAAPNQ